MHLPRLLALGLWFMAGWLWVGTAEAVTCQNKRAGYDCAPTPTGSGTGGVTCNGVQCSATYRVKEPHWLPCGQAVDVDCYCCQDNKLYNEYACTSACVNNNTTCWATCAAYVAPGVCQLASFSGCSTCTVVATFIGGKVESCKKVHGAPPTCECGDDLPAPLCCGGTPNINIINCCQ